MKDYVKTSLLLAVTLVCVVSCTKNSNTINGHEYVDLGLSVMWATCNVGASSPSKYGNYYAWGETEPKKEYTEENSVTFGKRMGSIAGNPQYDAATANWGSTWRLPTWDETDELIDKCKWEWTSQRGRKGYKVTGRNGNSIFLPFTGWRGETSLVGAGVFGCYWSATPDEGNKYRACNLSSHNPPPPIYNILWSYHRYYGYSVRPVSK